jgi:O-antigen/teichoic acid export membrane protein
MCAESAAGIINLRCGIGLNACYIRVTAQNPEQSFRQWPIRILAKPTPYMSEAFTRLAAIQATVLLTLSTFVTVVLGLVVSVVIARSLGPEDYGRYAFLLWLTALMITIGNHGVPITATRYISELLGRQELEAAKSLHGWLLRVQWVSLPLVGLFFAAALSVSLPIGWEGRGLLLALACQISFASKAIFLLGNSIANGYGVFGVSAWGSMIGSLIYTIGVLILAVMEASLTANIWWFSCVSVMHIAIILPLLKNAQIKASRATMPIEWLGKVRSHLGWSSLQIFVGTMGNRTFEIYLLSHLIGPAEVGFFVIAIALTSGGIELLSAGLGTILIPILAHAKGTGGDERFKRVVADATRYYLLSGVLLAGVGFFWAAPAIKVMYGARFDSVIPVLQCMVVINGLLLIDRPFSALLIVGDAQRNRTLLPIAQCGLSVVLAFALIPKFGLMGAVATNAISHTIISVIMVVWMSCRISLKPAWRDLLRIILAGIAAAMAATFVIFASNHLIAEFISGLVFAVVFVWLSVCFNVWKVHDARLLISIAERKPALFGYWLPMLKRWADRLERTA